MNHEIQIFKDRYWAAAKLLNRVHLWYASGCAFILRFGMRQANYKFESQNKTYKNFDLMGSETYFPAQKVTIAFNQKNPKQNYLDTST